MLSGIVWSAEAVMGRHRELKDGGMDGLTASRVVRWELVGDIPDPRMSPQDVPTGDVPTPDVPTCEVCGERPVEGRRRVCSGCRKAAYRDG